MTKKRGNPNWCKPQPFGPSPIITAFEQTAKMFELSPEQYIHSIALKEWVRVNKHDKFVPERLLDAWGFDDLK